MNNNERKTGIDEGNRSYTPKMFVTTDARQMAFDNYESLMFSQSGLTGAMPIYGMAAAIPPRGFGYATQTSGIGGTPSPIANGVMTPLVADPQFADAFIRNVTGTNTRLY